MAVKSPHPNLYFVVLSCVRFFTHLNEDANERLDGLRAGLRVLDENIFIFDEQNDGTCHFGDSYRGGFDDKHMDLSVFI